MEGIYVGIYSYIRDVRGSLGGMRNYNCFTLLWRAYVYTDM